MKKLLMTALIISASFLLTACTKPTAPTTQGPAEQSKTDDQKGTSVTGNIFDILNMGKAVKCTYSVKSETGEVSGTVYASGNNLKSDITVLSSDGTKTDTHMIADENWAYTWTSQLKQGIKMNLSDIKAQVGDKTNTDDSTKKITIEELKKNTNYTCLPWIVDASTFTLPSDITFSDISEMLKAIPSLPAGVKLPDGVGTNQ
jgi:hypothetical protein